MGGGVSRLMSVSHTIEAVADRRKTVTRRQGWWEDKNGRRILAPGDTLTLCRKVMGRKPGEPLDRLAEVEVLDVRRERLCDITNADVLAEGFRADWRWFVEFYCETFGGDRGQWVTRIEWRYLDSQENPDGK